MNGRTKETIIIVHGTWAAPKPDRLQWYQPNKEAKRGGFIENLDLALQERGSSARCWAHCSDQDPMFHWSGDNSWIARASAASALAHYIVKLRGDGWNCHIIAHSHGGNVVLDALGQLATPANLAWPSSSKIITLGTPYMDTLLSRNAQLKALTTADDTRIMSMIIWSTVVVMMSLVITTNSKPLFDSIGINYYLPHTLPVIFLTIGSLFSIAPSNPIFSNIRTYFYRYFAVFARGNSIALQESGKMRDVFLAMNSRFDEAWQVLYNTRNTKNPFAVKDNLILYLYTSFRSNIAIRDRSDILLYKSLAKHLSVVATILLWFMYIIYFTPLMIIIYLISILYVKYYISSGGPVVVEFTYLLIVICLLIPVITAWLVRGPLSKTFGDEFYISFLRPFRWLIHRAKSFGGIFGDIATYIIRYRAWQVLQRIAMGLDGYQSETPNVDSDPSVILGQEVTFMYMPKEAEQRALASRNTWATKYFGEFSLLFANHSKDTVSATSLLREIEENVTLVHGAYYTDDACIAEVANWIAGARSGESARVREVYEAPSL